MATPDQQRTKPHGREPTVETPSSSFPQQQEQLRRANESHGGFAAVGRSVANGSRMLARRVKHFLEDDMRVRVNSEGEPAASAALCDLATMELLAIQHRWLRGVQALLSILVFVLSLMSTPDVATLVNWTIFVISQLTTLVISKTYQVKAELSGLTSVFFEGRNIFTSPFFFEMVVELILWNIQTPPVVVFWKPFMNLINYFLFLRLYGVILYLHNAVYVCRTFCRAIEAISGLPLSTSFLVRTSLVYHRYRVGTVFLFTSWLTVGLMYAKAEGVSVTTGLWFSFQTLATLGYGDTTPTTLAGRLVVVLAGLCTFSLLAYAIVCGQAILVGSDEELNVQLLARCHDLTHELRSRSAWVIQIAWKYRRMRRQADLTPTKRQKLKVIAVSLLLTHFIAALRRTRQGLRASQRAFCETDLHPLTGLSSYQYRTYVYETQQAARLQQRLKDIDRVYLALKDRDIPASSLSREDVFSIIIPRGADRLRAMASLRGQVTTSPRPASAPGSFVESHTYGQSLSEPPSLYNSQQWQQQERLVSSADVKVWEERLAGLEAKCAQLSSLLDATMAAAAHDTPA